MAAKYDLEMLVDSIVSLLQANLNTKITAINTEKNDTVSLDSVNSSAYFKHELNSETINYNPFILASVLDISTTGYGPASMDDVTIEVLICVIDEGEDLFIGKRMLRYLRCIKEVFESNFYNLAGGHKLEISSVLPQFIKDINSNRYFRTVGVNITTSMVL